MSTETNVKVIKTALLSFGMSGQVFHAPFIDLHPGFELLGSWERSKRLIASKYSNTRSYESLEEVLADPEVDLVIINTPTFTHYEYAKKALLAGKHVVVEKAFTGTVAEAEELRDLGNEKGLKVCVYQNRRWDSDFKTVREVVEQRLVGDVIEATIGFLRYNPDLSPKTHKERPSDGAGIIKDLGAHVLDQAITLFGMPEHVSADIRITRSGSKVDDYFDILLKYEALSVHVKGGYFFKEPGPSFIIHGTRGSFMKSRADVQEDQLKAGMSPNDKRYGIEPDEESGLLNAIIEGQEVRKSLPSYSGDYKQYYEDVHACIVHDRPAPVSAQDGVNVMKLIEAAFESAEKKRLITIK